MTMIRTLVALCALLLLTLVLSSPVWAAPLNDGDLLVADAGAGQVRQFSSTGEDLGVFAGGLNLPSWITAGPDGAVYVTEYGAHRIVKIGTDGTILLTIPTSFTPAGVAVIPDGTIYVAQYNGGKLHKFAKTGAYLGVFVTIGGTGTDTLKYDSYALYVSDWRSGLITRVASSDGRLLEQFSGGAGALGITIGLGHNIYIGSYTGGGFSLFVGATEFPLLTQDDGGLYGLSTDRKGDIYAADYNNGVVRKYTVGGASLGLAASGLSNPRDVHVWRGTPTLDKATAEIIVAITALTKLRNAAQGAHTYAAAGNYPVACNYLKAYRTLLVTQAQNVVELGSESVAALDAAATGTAKMLGCP
jgi:hypothetical protein